MIMIMIRLNFFRYINFFKFLNFNNFIFEVYDNDNDYDKINFF